MKNKDCELVKDLLPSYVDGLTSDETNEFIESHVKECPECKALLNDMKRETVAAETVKSKKFVKFAKKYKKKLHKEKSSRESTRNRDPHVSIPRRPIETWSWKAPGEHSHSW